MLYVKEPSVSNVKGGHEMPDVVCSDLFSINVNLQRGCSYIIQPYLWCSKINQDSNICGSSVWCLNTPCERYNPNHVLKGLLFNLQPHPPPHTHTHTHFFPTKLRFLFQLKPLKDKMFVSKICLAIYLFG